MAKRMYKKSGEFEQKAKEAQQIIAEINNGGIYLTDLLAKYKKANSIAVNLRYTLQNIKDATTKVSQEDGQEVPFSRDKGGKVVTNSVKVPDSDKTSSNDSSGKSTKNTTTNTGKRPTSNQQNKPNNPKGTNGRSKGSKHFNPSSLF